MSSGKPSSAVVKFGKANVGFLPLVLGSLALPAVWTLAAAHSVISICLFVASEATIFLAAWFYTPATATGLIGPMEFGATDRECLRIRFATSEDMPGTEWVYLQWFDDALSVDDAEFCMIMNKGSSVRVIEEDLANGTQTATRVIGYYSVWPLSMETFEKLCTGAKQERDLTAVDVLNPTNESAYTLYISEICVARNAGPEAGARLLRDLLRYAKCLLEDNGNILSVSAWAYTDTGMRLSEDYRMKPEKNGSGPTIHSISRAHALASPKMPKGKFKPRWQSQC